MDAPRPRVIAHRGSSEDVAEHTLAAYEKAIADGADGLECDVRLTADGHLVCVHDRRVERTSNGRGPVSALELADLAELDFGGWRRGWDLDDEAEWPERTRTGILTLDRLLRVVRDAGRPLELAVETKHPTRYAGLVERRLVELLDRHGLAHPPLGAASAVRVMSFSPLSLRRLRRLAPSVSTVLLMDRLPLRFRDGSLPVNVRSAGPGIDVVRRHPAAVRAFQEQGHEVHVWTVNDAADVRRCVDLGVDVIITDRPAAVLGQLASGRAP
ncbi:MAG TPA: glycerophosphodiester phosphodiesterase family protein [Jiangellales bacterium]|nr:glycerophosphodiester phosphodiesterase family protein [Jiangellales bacterium]